MAVSSPHLSFFKPAQQEESNPVALQLKNLSKTFKTREGGHVAVHNVNLEIRQGELITLLGPSGCGKTTTLRLIAGFEQPTTGEIILDGQTINHIPANQRPMAMVFQGFALFPHMTVFDNISYGLRIQRTDKTIIQETVEVVMALMNLVGLNERMPHQLSGGQQQRVALARSLVMQPRVLLFDEPLSNLDAKLREHMRTEIRNLQQRLKITSIYVTHDQTEAMSISDRIVVMNESKIEQVASPIEIYMEPKTIFVADFVGNSNFIKSVVLGTSENHVQVDFFGTPIQVSSNGHTLSKGDFIYIIVRPDAISVQPWSEEESKTYVDGQVKQAEFLGTHAYRI